MIEQGIVAKIKNDGALTALIAGRVYPVKFPNEPTFPLLVYQVVAAGTNYALDGAAETWKRVQFDAWGNTYAETKAVQAAIHDLFSGFSGALADGCFLQGAFRRLEVDDWAERFEVPRALCDYEFHYIEG